MKLEGSFRRNFWSRGALLRSREGHQTAPKCGATKSGHGTLERRNFIRTSAGDGPTCWEHCGAVAAPYFNGFGDLAISRSPPEKPKERKKIRPTFDLRSVQLFPGLSLRGSPVLPRGVGGPSGFRISGSGAEMGKTVEMEFRGKKWL